MPRKGGLDTEAIRALALAGLSVSEISQRLNKEYNSIYRHAKDRGIDILHRTKRNIRILPDLTPISTAALRLAAFDPCVRRALRVRMGEDLKLPGAREFAFSPNFYAMLKARKKKSEGGRTMLPPSEVP